MRFHVPGTYVGKLVGVETECAMLTDGEMEKAFRVLDLPMSEVTQADAAFLRDFDEDRARRSMTIVPALEKCIRASFIRC